MTPTKIKISDSSSLYSIKTDKFKTGMISLYLPLPLTPEISAYNLILSGVLRRGCEKFPSTAALNRRLDELYASTIEIKSTKFGNNEMLIISAEILDNAFTAGENVLSGTLEVISQILLNPISDGKSFPEDIFKHEKSNIIDALRAEINNPRAYAANRCSELLHKNNPCFSSMNELLQTISNTDSETLYKHYKHLLNTAPINFFYVGSENEDSVALLINKYFTCLSADARPLNLPVAENFTELRDVTEEMPLSQGKLSIAFRLGVTASDKEYFAAMMLNEIFGASPASKLFMNVREKLGLCYYCSSSYNVYHGNITVSSGINVSDKNSAFNEILSQLEDIKNGLISPEEMTAAKKSLTHWYRQIYDYPFELFTFYSIRNMFSINASPDAYIEEINKITPEQISALAKQMKLDTVYFLKGTLDGTESEEADE